MNKLKGKNLLYIGEKRGNSYSRFNTLSKHFKESKIISFYHLYGSIVNKILLRTVPSLFVEWSTNFIEEEAKDYSPDVVWIEKGHEIHSQFLHFIRSKGCLTVNTYSDNFMMEENKHFLNNYKKSIPYYDIIFTPQTETFKNYKLHGAKRVEKFWKGFDHHSISDRKKPVIENDFIFAGHLEQNRLHDINRLTETKKFKFSIFGDGWEMSNLESTFPSLPFDSYGKVFENTEIGLNYFSWRNKDSQNSRLFEIPASKSMLISEFSEDAAACFEPEKEGVFFSSYEELEDKMSFYVKNESSRQEILKKGYKKAVENYSNEKRATNMLRIVESYL